MSNEPDPNELDHTVRNTLTVGLFCGAAVGFMIAMCIGVIKLNGDDGATDWIVAVTAVAAVFISGLAVVLVSQTLKATRDTLIATVEAGVEQKRIGDLQTRAWVSYDFAEVKELGGSSVVEIIPCIRNFGSTPARNVRLSCQSFRMILPEHFFSEDEIFVELRELPPEKGVTSTTGPIEILSKFAVLIKVSWTYEAISGKEGGDSIFVLLKVIDGAQKAEPLTKSDFYLLDEEFGCHSRSIILRNLQEILVETNGQIDS